MSYVQEERISIETGSGVQAGRGRSLQPAGDCGCNLKSQKIYSALPHLPILLNEPINLYGCVHLSA